MSVMTQLSRHGETAKTFPVRRHPCTSCSKAAASGIALDLGSVRDEFAKASVPLQSIDGVGISFHRTARKVPAFWEQRH